MAKVLEAVGFTIYRVVVQVLNRLEGGVPKNPDMIKSWLETKGISDADIAQKTVAAMENPEEVAAVMEEAATKGWCGFKQSDGRYYFEARCIKSGFKESANVLKELLGIKNARARLAERVFVRGREDLEAIYLNVEGALPYDERVVHAMSRSGPINALKRNDYVEKPQLEFFLRVLKNSDFDNEDILRAILFHMASNGLGANRSQGAGQFELVELKKVGELNLTQPSFEKLLATV